MMRYDSLNHFAYVLVGIMKKSLKKKGSDPFKIKDFNILKMRICSSDSIASLNLLQLKEILTYVDMSCNLFEGSEQRKITYAELRNLLKNNFSSPLIE